MGFEITEKYIEHEIGVTLTFIDNRNTSQLKILFISPFLSPDSIGGPALRAKNTQTILSQIASLIVFDLEGITKYSWSGGGKFDSASNLDGPNDLRQNMNQSIFKFVSRFLQLIEISTQLITLSSYFKLRNLIRESDVDIVWFSYSSDYPKLFISLRKCFPDLSFIADTQAVVSTHLSRAAIEIGGFRGFIYKLLAKKKWREENQLLKVASITTAVSKFDAEEYRARGTGSRIEMFPNVVTVRDISDIELNKSKHPSILITGTFGGIESAMTHGTKWFIEHVLPAIQAKVSDVEVTIVGRNSELVRKVMDLPSNVATYQNVESLDPFFKFAWLSVCPLFFESGTRFKILEASERALATVSTSLGAEGLEMKEPHGILIADSVEDFAESVIELLRDGHLAVNVGMQAREIVKSNYSIEAGIEVAQRIMNRR
jgi:glycosyltransferase involved in cell wall biosynthesis